MIPIQRSVARMNRRLVVQTAGLLATGWIAAGRGSSVSAQTASFSVTLLDGLDFEGSAQAVGLQDDGSVIFNVDSDIGPGVFRWQGGETARLGGSDGPITATAVSDEGVITGWSGVPSSGTPTSGPEPVLIGDDNIVYMPGGGPGQALGSNVAEAIVGSQTVGSMTTVPTRWTTSEAIALDLPNGFQTGEAVDINILDQIIGSAGDFQSGTRQGLLWEDGTPVLMGTLGGASSTAVRINDSGLAVGYSTLTAGDKDLDADPTGAFEWLAGQRSPLPSLEGAVRHRPTDLNETNLVTGIATLANGDTVAVIWAAGAIDDLNTLVSADATIRLTEAISTNRFGSILCRGIDAQGDDRFAVLDVLGN